MMILKWWKQAEPLEIEKQKEWNGRVLEWQFSITPSHMSGNIFEVKI
jgi:hypothetical protein